MPVLLEGRRVPVGRHELPGRPDPSFRAHERVAGRRGVAAALLGGGREVVLPPGVPVQVERHRVHATRTVALEPDELVRRRGRAQCRLDRGRGQEVVAPRVEEELELAAAVQLRRGLGRALGPDADVPGRQRVADTGLGGGGEVVAARRAPEELQRPGEQDRDAGHPSLGAYERVAGRPGVAPPRVGGGGEVVAPRRAPEQVERNVPLVLGLVADPPLRSHEAVARQHRADAALRGGGEEVVLPEGVPVLVERSEGHGAPAFHGRESSSGGRAHRRSLVRATAAPAPGAGDAPAQALAVEPPDVKWRGGAVRPGCLRLWKSRPRRGGRGGCGTA